MTTNNSFIQAQDSMNNSSGFLGEEYTQRNFFSQSPIKNKKKLIKRFDTNEAKNNFCRNLRGCQTKHTVTSTRNPYTAIWSTEPTQRIDRPRKLKDIHFIRRGGHNKKLDDANKMGVIDQPISYQMLRMSTLRKQTTAHLQNLVKPPVESIEEE